MSLRALRCVPTACAIVMFSSGCSQKQTADAVVPAVEPPVSGPTVESEAAKINSQPSINDAVAQQLRYQKILEGDSALRAKQKVACQGGEQNAFLLPTPLQRPCRALADAEFNAQLNEDRKSHVTNTNSL